MTDMDPPASVGTFTEPALTPPLPASTQTSPRPAGSEGGAGAKDVALDQAASVGHGAADAGSHVAGVAKEQTAQVASEAASQAKDLVNQAQVQLKEQTQVRQQQLADGLRSLSEELHSMANGSEKPGVAADVARQAADRASQLAGWVGGREPKAILDDASRFARRRPGTFLAVCLGIGFLGGRLTRGMTADAKADDTGLGGSGALGATGTSPDYVDLSTTPAPVMPPLPPTPGVVPPTPGVSPIAADPVVGSRPDPLIPGSGYLGEGR